ncbi:MAG TPA: immunoglobulin domain-containing protein, partial [Verrucomicrobiae bacterium]|nr:immunoglobulin domain-containing protein [Verrucomicrobiae bacterium]
TVTPTAGLTIVSGLTLTSANDAPDRDPATYTLEGSYDGVTFTMISSGDVPPFGTTRFLKNTILFDNKIPYLSYRLIFPTTAGNSTCCMQVSEVEFLGVLAPGDVTVPGDPIVATSNNSPGSEGVANAIDNAPTKYLNFDKVNTGFTVTPSVGDTIVIGLSLTSANDAPDRDPATYDLSGSLDGVTFFPIASGDVPPFGTTRFLKNYVFFPENTKAFKTYRLIFPTTAGNSTCCMQVSEVEFLGTTPGVVNTNAVDTLIRQQPQDTPVLLGSQATFRVVLTGPWSVQWYRDGQKIAGANNAVYKTAPATAADDGAHYQAVVQGRDGRQVSDEVLLSIFTPSTTESIGISWHGGGANGAPTDLFSDDITGFFPQAYWNNVASGGGALPNPIDSANLAHPTIAVTWATSGEWGVGTGNEDPLGRLFNGTCTSFATAEDQAQTVTLTGVPPGRHSLLLYTVQVPAEFFNMNFKVKTFNADGTDKAVQSRFTRPQNGDEFKTSPGFLLMTSSDPASRSVGNMMRFDGLESDNGSILITMWAPGRAQPVGQDPIRGPGLNAFQLLLDPSDVGASPVITKQPSSVTALLGGVATFTVEATGPNLSYQWLKGGKPIQGANSTTLIVSDLTASDEGVYFVAVSNPAGRVRSRSVALDIVTSRDLSLGLVNYFKLDDAGGAVATNAVASGQPGEVRGQFQDWTPDGRIGGALLFEGDNYVFVPDYTKPRQAMTVAGWVYSGSTDWGPLVNNWVTLPTAGLSGQFVMEVVVVDGAPNLRGVIEVGPNKVIAIAPVPNADLGTWHHFALSANGLSLDTYWDGQPIASTDYSGQIGNNVPAIPWLAIGAELSADPTTSVKVFPGTDSRFDDVAMWNRSLGPAELVAIYNGGLAGQNISQVPPVINPLLRLTATINAGQLQLIATGSPNSSWRLESRNNIAGPDAWTQLQNITLGATPTTITQPLTSAQKFYRGVLLP